MSDKEKILKTLSSLIETGILTANDVKKELVTNFKFKKDSLLNQLDLVSRDEFEILKKIVENQEVKINKLSRKKTKKVKKS
ncbi:MAG: accessory factor UbiK family protein [Pseudomonadota bacterium]|nr:accessory factor UbiK family protein [Pseudomonadota bacterium]